MKRILTLILLAALTLTLSSCDIESLFETTIELRQNETVKVDFKDYYGTLPDQKVKIHYYDKVEVAYMEINQYLDLMESMSYTDLFTYEEVENGFILSYTSPWIDEEFTLRYNHINGDMTVNHFEFFEFYDEYLYIEPSSDYHEFDIEDAVYQFSDEVVVHLSEYGLQGVEDDGDYMFPIDLLNLMFASFESGLYLSGNDLYSVWYEFWGYGFMEEAYYDMEVPEDVQFHTWNYFGFYFDYFYGNNFDKDQYYYIEWILNNYNTSGLSDPNRFHEEIDRMLLDMDDMHLWLANETHYGEAYDFDVSDYEYSGRTLESYNHDHALSPYCNSMTTRRLNDNIVLFVIKEFTDDAQETFIDEYHDYVDEYTTDIVIDLSCNVGGYSSEVIDLLPYFTDEPISLYFESFRYGSTYEFGFTSTVEKIPQNIYIKISPVSYSSSNVLALYVQANDLGVIVGRNSTGGSSSIDTYFGPSGLVFTGPALYHDTDSLGNNYEFGVEVDYVLDIEGTTALIQLIEELRN